MTGHSVHPFYLTSFEIFLALLLSSALFLYIWAAARPGRHRRKWPLYRTVLWVAGIVITASAVIGPIVSLSHTDFRTHMFVHLLLGMLAPLLIAASAPVTLMFRTLDTKTGRFVSRIVRSRLFRFLGHPVTASFLNIGGLWILYTTGLYSAMQENLFLHGIVHLHLFLAGYVFTASMLYIDPFPHRFSFYYRSIVLTIAMGCHSIIAKYLYAHPPEGVPASQAEAGSKIMYYGGDLIHLAIIMIFCWKWYQTAAPRLSSSLKRQL